MATAHTAHSQYMPTKVQPLIHYRNEIESSGKEIQITIISNIQKKSIFSTHIYHAYKGECLILVLCRRKLTFESIDTYEVADSNMQLRQKVRLLDLLPASTQ